MASPQAWYEMYEYKVTSTLSLKGLERELNRLAVEGWRVVTAPPHLNTVILERAGR